MNHAVLVSLSLSVMVLCQLYVLQVQAWGEKNVSARINAIAVAIRAGMTVEALGQVDFVYSSSSCSIWDPVQIVCGQAQ